MAENPREILDELVNGARSIKGLDSERFQGWVGFSKAVLEPGALDLKTKELICAALGLHTHCKYCIVFHIYQALKAGATREELIETAFTTGMMGGGPVMTYGYTLFLDSINTFAPDFEK
ncbi:carboxymuconolactone decarboxylase family protein [Chloroflexota bacterium]